MQWQRMYGGANHDEAYSLAELPGGGYVVVGETESIGVGHDDVYIIRTDADGNLKWQRAFGGSGNDFAYGVTVTANAVFANGWAGSPELTGYLGSYDAYVVAVNLDGEKLWDHCFGGSGYDGSQDIVASNGTVTIMGHKQDEESGVTVPYLFQVGVTGGELVWERTYGTSPVELRSVARATDGGYLLAGARPSETGAVDIWLVKTDIYGNTAPAN